MDDADLSATYFWITNSVGVDLNKTISDQMEQIITSLGLTDEKLLEAYENTTGSPLEVREGESVSAALAREANSRYADLDEKYEAFASAARSWNEGHEEYLAGLGEYVQGLSAYEESLAIWEEGRDALRAKWEEYYQGVADYEAGLNQYEEGLAAYEEGVAKLDEGKEQYLAGLEELQKSKEKLKEGEEQYKEGLSEYEEGKDRLQEAQDKLDSMEEGRWVFFGVQGNTSYMHLMYSAESTSKLSLTFSMMFIVIAALVIYATVGRIVQEQRKLIGTTKALGFFNREILAKYMLFGLGSTFIGTVLGIAIAYFGIEPILLGTYQMAYVLDGIERKIQVLTTLLVAFGALGLAAAAVYLACRSQLRSTAISLMQEQMPKGKKASSGKGRHSGGQQTGRLYNRLILRNIRSDIPRVAVTIVSVAGCCALLVIGFTLRGAVSGAIDRQYGQIIRFDYRLVFNPQQAENAERELETILREEGTDYVAVQDEIRLYRPAEKLDMTELVVGDMDQLSRFYAFTDWQSGQPLKIPASGAILKGRIAEANAVETGEQITIYNDLMKPFPVTVEAMYQNYIGRELFISNETYKEVFGEERIPNTFLIRLQGADPDKLAERLSKVEGFESFETSATEKAKFEDYTKVLTLISLLLTLVAGLMAYFILLNICNMYISQKKRELVIMRINGFTVREVKNYVARETIYTTAAGILLGLGFGSAVGYQIIRFVELPYVQFVRSINLTAWALAVVITLAFVWFINYLSLRQVSHLKLTDM